MELEKTDSQISCQLDKSSIYSDSNSHELLSYKYLTEMFKSLICDWNI